MAQDPSKRDTLASRVLPQMVLSEAGNVLTAPLAPLPDNLSTAERALARFSVRGNAILTGGTGALATTATRALLEHGLSGLCLLDISFRNSNIVAELERDFPAAKVIFKSADVTDAIAVGVAIDEAHTELGSIDMLLCFAGIVGCTHSIDTSPEQWKRVLDVNTTGSWLCAQAVAKYMISQNVGGSILFTASISGHRVNFPQPQIAYNTSKAAVLALKSSLAAEWARYGIRVNSISPGYMDTVLNEGEGLHEAREIWASRNPMGRMGAPEELTGAVVLLCSRAGRYMTGTDIVVDGGGIVF